ncbi:MAG: restriction endonuclease subunit S, partial [Bradyrhizobium sp.]|nr:restriction endonuclease subunit S [Bradyrhizobium sp.]
KDHQQWMLTQAGNKATMASLNQDIIRRIPVTAPPPDTQERVVDVLSAYDDLIENNRRRMALLEESARLLYREWFVRLHFPGHERTPVIDGIPEGWESHLLDDLCSIGRGASPRPIADFMGGETPWFKIGDATASESFFIFETAEHVSDEGAKRSVILEPGSLILSNSATCGIPYFTAVRGCVHDGWLHFSQFERISEQFLYCYLFLKREELVSSVSDGSTQKNLNTSAVGRLRLVLPKQDALIVQFQDAIGPVFEMVLNLARQNNSLRAARDLLLPRLMSGEIAV